MTRRVDIHGLSRREVVALLNKRLAMIHRCHNQNADNYKYYGAKGIAVCQEWIAAQCRLHRRQYQRPRTDRQSGGWHGLHIDLQTCVHKSAGKPTPRPGPRHMATK